MRRAPETDGFQGLFIFSFTVGFLKLSPIFTRTIQQQTTTA